MGDALTYKRRAVLVREEACPARLLRRTFRRHHVHQRVPVPFERMCGLRYNQGDKWQVAGTKFKYSEANVNLYRFREMLHCIYFPI